MPAFVKVKGDGASEIKPAHTSPVNHSKDQDMVALLTIEDHVTAMFVASDVLLYVPRQPPHSWILSEQFKAMVQAT